ncbi:MAG TPA: hypothetical protein EYP49_21615 [Anaerolineae bacterium]|nr:hypothetical protein [Anaerolineae bacterium]
MLIEPRCAFFGSRIADEKSVDSKRLQTVVRNSLGVLREEGLFAFYLYLKYRWDEGGQVIWEQIKSLWEDEVTGPLWKGGLEDREGVIALTESLYELVLAREVAEKALTYALYGLRAGD